MFKLSKACQLTFSIQHATYFIHITVCVNLKINFNVDVHFEPMSLYRSLLSQVYICNLAKNSHALKYMYEHRDAFLE